MRLITASVLLIAVISQVGCSYPQNRQEFTSHPDIQKRTFTVPRNLDAVITSLDNRIQVCVNKTFRSGSVSSSSVSAQYMVIKRLSSSKAELTYRQRTNNGVGEADGGYFLFAADLISAGKQSTKVTFYHGYLQETLMNAVKEWIGGNDSKCHGYGGD